jgi:hypothetical protein
MAQEVRKITVDADAAVIRLGRKEFGHIYRP